MRGNLLPTCNSFGSSLDFGWVRVNNLLLVYRPTLPDPTEKGEGKKFNQLS